MRKFMGETYLYLHEKINVTSATARDVSDMFAKVYQPAMERLGARLFSFWESSPFNAHWPQLTVIWELDNFAAYAAIGAAQAPGGAEHGSLTEWQRYLASAGATGEGRIMYPGQHNRTLAELRDANLDSFVVIEEIMTTHPGKQQTYIEQLKRLYVPWSESTGKIWLGSFVTYFRFNEVIHYWALEGGWDGFAKHYPSWKGDPPAEITTWMTVAPSMRDGWEDSVLQALPPHPLTGSN
jgi:hypothetical protein